MHAILKKELLAPGICLMRVEAPAVAAKARAGQFFVLRADERGERVPFTFLDWDAAEGWVEFVFLAVGATTRRLLELGPGDRLLDVVGPLGNPSQVAPGRWAVAGGGVGLAAAYPVARALARAGAQVTCLVGARSRELLVLEDRFRAIPGARVVVTTDDGSYGEKGFVAAPLGRLCAAGEVDRVFAVGPVPMMRACAQVADGHGVPVTVSLNPVMLDGTGMCGGCRVLVGGEVRFACIHGVDFDGSQVDWDDLGQRLRMYRAEEAQAVERSHACRIAAAAERLEAAAAEEEGSAR
jgi:ferredoxin--NADP+ reductase